MKIYLLSILVLGIIFFGCSRDNNPVITEKEEINYSGDIGSERAYRITTQWFKLGSSTPFYDVPDSLISRIIFPDSLRLNGYIEIEEIISRMTEMDSEYYLKQDTTIPRKFYKNEFADWKKHSLIDEVTALMEGRDYSPSEFYNIIWGRWLETNKKLIALSNIIYIEKPLEVNKMWVRDSGKVPDGSGGFSTYQSEAEVIGREEITTLAGSFLAYKVVVVTHWVESNMRLYGTYQYYVPNIGLVLEETKGTVVSSVNNQTIYYDQVYRKELISYKN
jgi:hypothetical protein